MHKLDSARKYIKKQQKRLNLFSGLEYIYQLSQLQNTKLRIEMKRFTEETIYYAEYRSVCQL